MLPWNGTSLGEIEADLADWPDGPRLSRGITVAAGKMWPACLRDEGVLLKVSPGATAQVVADELKPHFFLAKMGTHLATYRRAPAVVLRYWPNGERLQDRKDLWDHPPVKRALLTILVYEYCVRTGDRTLGNVLVVPKTMTGDELLLPIDEMSLFSEKPFRVKFTASMRKRLAIAWAGDRSWLRDHCTRVVDSVRAPGFGLRLGEITAGNPQARWRELTTRATEVHATLPRMLEFPDSH